MNEHLPSGLSPGRGFWTLLTVCMGTFMLLVDITIVNVGLPSIQRELHASLTGLQWVVDAYSLSLATLILTAGVLSDRFGRRRVFALGVAAFTLASLGCAVAQTTVMLDAARAVQGIGGAAMFATSLALIAQEFAGARRAGAIAVWGSTVGGAVAVGPLLGGLLTEGLGWRWIFFVNLPVGLATVALAWARLAPDRSTRARRVDIGGLAAFSAALLLVVSALLRGNADGWAHATVAGSLVAGAVMLIVFVAVERRVREPMLDLALFTHPTFVGVSAATFAIGAGMFAMFLFLSLYLQGVLGFGPLGAGLRLLPITLMVLVVPLVTGRLAQRVSGRVTLSLGLALVGTGLLAMRVLSAGSGWTALLPGFILAGVGIGIANPAIASTALSVAGPERSGMASGFSNTCRIAGLATGVAALGALFQHQIAAGLGPLARLAPVVASSGTHALHGASRASAAVAREAFVGGLRDILLVGAAVVLSGAAAAWSLVRVQAVGAAAAAPPPRGVAEPTQDPAAS